MTDVVDKALAWDVIAEKNSEIARIKGAHKNVVHIKRITNIRLKIALAALQQIYTVCKDNEPDSCDARMALAFVRSAACDAFEKATSPLPRPNGETP